MDSREIEFIERYTTLTEDEAEEKARMKSHPLYRERLHKMDRVGKAYYEQSRRYGRKLTEEEKQAIDDMKAI
ncbi:hypothetical protein KIPB_016926 [Kipferlia bialata]|uniref:Uncharacterized protein n=1 Tax=Kipferlia bialata TaxID=797122 RepID=A0A9K3DCZ2_9EUKA|nr:hypothetical protein KIPB_016926 [Kipferlia bialata]|eukprot:g16926.t1